MRGWISKPGGWDGNRLFVVELRRTGFELGGWRYACQPEPSAPSSTHNAGGSTDVTDYEVAGTNSGSRSADVRGRAESAARGSGRTRPAAKPPAPRRSRPQWRRLGRVSSPARDGEQACRSGAVHQRNGRQVVLQDEARSDCPAVLAAGVGYAVYSANNDRITSPAKQ